MFDIGISEIGVIAVVALIVIGPERLPRVARTVGTLLGRAQRYVNDVKAEVNREIELEELRKLQKDMQDAARGIQEQVTTAGADMQSAVHDMEKQLQQGVSAVESSVGTDAIAPSVPSIEGPAGTAGDPSARPLAGEPSAAGPAAGSAAAEPSFQPTELQEPPMEPVESSADTTLLAAEATTPGAVSVIAAAADPRVTPDSVVAAGPGSGMDAQSPQSADAQSPVPPAQSSLFPDDAQR